MLLVYDIPWSLVGSEAEDFKKESVAKTMEKFGISRQEAEEAADIWIAAVNDTDREKSMPTTHEDLVKTVNELMMSITRLSDTVCKLRIMIIESDPALNRSGSSWVQQAEYGYPKGKDRHQRIEEITSTYLRELAESGDPKGRDWKPDDD